MIRASDVVKEYVAHEGRHRVLDGISFSVAKGEKMAVLGRNGAGKSTLVKLLGGVEAPTSGRIDLGMSLSWTVMNLSLGGPAFPPLGPVFIKPPPAPPEAPRGGTETL